MTKLYIIPLFLLITITGLSQQATNSGGRSYLRFLDDARIDVGLKISTIFALDDRAPLSSNPHFQAMWNLIQLGAKIEGLIQGSEETLNDLDLSREFGRNGYNKAVFMFFIRYGFGESSDVALQKHFFELGLSSGFFKEGRGGMNIHLDYMYNLFKTGYGAGGNSIDRPFDYEIFVGGRLGYDWSSGRSEEESGFFSHLNDELKRIADENEFTAAQLIMLQELAEESKILLPEDVGGRAFHIGPLVGGRVSTKLVKNLNAFIDGYAFYDLMDLGGSEDKENQRSQHHFSLSLGVSLKIGSEGEFTVSNFF